ncbi:MAG: bifunctional oligoribonuclease/PAP phosphatase NrnA [Clostridiales bacterium]|nr:bifunctional oligoribonuclease/PAP phosphatase NrnA [Clostridiales bacterium]
MSDVEAVNSIIEGLEKYGSFSILTHVSPDGDTLGAALAMYQLIIGMGKKAEVICEEPVPHIYGYLPFADKVVLPDGAKGYECVLTVDCADMQRFKKADHIFKAAKHTMAIDHHFTNKGYADANLIRADASATCEVIFDLYRAMDKPISSEAAVCLYTGIVTDTGNLTYSNTTPKCIRMVADLYENGLNITEINRNIYRTVPFSKTRLQGYALANMKLELGGKIGIATLTIAEMNSFGATNEDCEGIVDSVRDVECVRVAVFIREGRDGTYKVSLRSKECADVGRIANKYGGGGHAAAAGYTSTEPLSTTIANVLRDVTEELENDKN